MDALTHEGFDGILYDSALSQDGYNLALFNAEASKPLKGFKVEVKSVSYDYLESELPAQVADSHPVATRPRF